MSDPISANVVIQTTNNDEQVAAKAGNRKRRGFHTEMFQETSYYFKGGLRCVYPYSFTFKTHIKGRWLNKTLLDVFCREFHMETPEYYQKAIRTGKIKVNGEIASVDRKLMANDILTTQVHRHEPPVLDEAIEFLQNDDDMVVINKPSSIPVHPCGRHRHNTVVFLLGKEYGLQSLHTIHRIDRLTSGILMFAKTANKARDIENAIKKRLVKKQYLARVIGEFPMDEVTVDKPILTVSHKIGVCRVHEDGKSCTTSFKRMHYDGRTSVVRCWPHTGRMHQIRVHLQFLGHPIVNDPIYNHPTAWSNHQNDKALETQMIIDELIRTRKDRTMGSDDLNLLASSKSIIEKKHEKEGCSFNKKLKLDDGNEIAANSILPPKNDQCKPASEAKNSALLGLNTGQDEVSLTPTLDSKYYDEDCTDCQRTWKDPEIHELVMFLHAYEYKGPDWEYKTAIPAWAAEDWKP